MQNKPNSPIIQLNLIFLLTMIYTISTCLTKVKNKPNTNPFKPNLSQFQCLSNLKQSQFKTKRTQLEQSASPIHDNIDQFSVSCPLSSVFHLTYAGGLLNCIKSRRFAKSLQNCPYQYQKPAFIAVRIPYMRNSYQQERRYYHVD
jgi:hypothetical protein